MKQNFSSIAIKFLLCYSLLIAQFKPASALQLSDSIQISLLTVAPGSELYSAFGHSGIRVKDFKQNIDVVFNYGTFDFYQPNFYVNFIRGRLLYMIDVGSFDGFMAMYVDEERSVEEDILNLTIEEQQRIFTFLVKNVQPENRNYRYEFFFDNCATRIRDVFENELEGKLHFNYSGFDTTKTLRQMLDLYVNHSPWVQFGFYLILGLPCDIVASPRTQAFLPDFLEKTFKQATVQTKNGSEPFVVQSRNLLNYPLPKESNSLFTPVNSLLALLLLVIALTYFEIKSNKHSFGFDFLLFFLSGLLGVFFLSMWAFTEHYSVAKNLNVLWAVPLFLPLSFFLLFKRVKAFNFQWLRVTCVWLLLLLPLQFILPQPFYGGISILILSLAIRAWSGVRFFKNN